MPADAPTLVANVPRQAVDAADLASGQRGHGEPAAGGAARPGLTMATARWRAALAPHAPAVKPHVHWQDRLAQGLLLVVLRRRSRCSCSAPLAAILVKSVQDKDGAFVGLAQFRRVLRDTRAAQLDLEHAVGRVGGDGDHGAARVLLRVRAHALVHAGQDRVPRHRADADPRAVAHVGDLVHPVVRQPGGC